jgi:hypothetical protein
LIESNQEAQMNVELLRRWSVLTALLLILSMMPSTVFAAAAASATAKAKQEAEAGGYAFELSHDDIVSKAKREGKLRILTSLESEKLKPVAEAFRKKYPFIELRAEEIAGTATYQRMLLEMKAGTARGWDVNFIVGDFYDEYLPHQKRFDILGMAQQRILQIPVGMIDPVNRNIVAYTTNTMVVTYNKNLLAEEKVPSQWEEFLKAEFNGRKFLADIRPQFTSALVPAWGIEKTLAFAKKISAQNPVWVGGHSRALASLATGEHGVYLGANLTGTKSFKRPILPTPLCCGWSSLPTRKRKSSLRQATRVRSFLPERRLFRWRGQRRFLWWTGVTIPRCKSICGWSWKRMVFPRPKPPANNSPEFSPNRAGARVTR